jgi:hypothetical protein
VSEVQAIEVRAVAPKVPREPKAADAKPRVPLRRLAVATADMAVLAGTGAVAEFGVFGAAAGAAVAVGVPLVARASRRAAERRAEAREARSARSSASRSPGIGLDRGSRGGGSRGGGSSGSSGGGPGKAPGSGAGGGTGRSLRNLLGGGPGRDSSGRGGGLGRGGSPGGTGRSTGGGSGGGAAKPKGAGNSGSSSPGGSRMLGLFDRLTGRSPSLRQQRRHERGLTKDQIKLDDWARKRRDRRDRKKQKADEAKARPLKSKVSTDLRGDQDQADTAPVPVPQPEPAGTVPVPGREIPTQEGTRMADGVTNPAMKRMLGLAEQMVEIAVKNAPDGNLEVLAGYEQMPVVMETVTKALGHFHRAAGTQGLSPAVLDYTEAMVKAQNAVVTATRAIAPAIEKIHRRELDYLRAGGSSRWDRGVNGAAAPRRSRGAAAASSAPAAPESGAASA